MPPYRIKIHKDIIRPMLIAQQTNLCAFRVENLSDPSSDDNYLQDYVTADGVDETMISRNEKKLFGFGSGMKLFINVAIYRMLNDAKEVLKDPKVCEIMLEARVTSAFELYNKLRLYNNIRTHGESIPPWREPKSRGPTIFHLMTHSYAFLAHPRGLVGPDGKFLMSEKTFGETFANIVDGASPNTNGDYCYSNWNTMLLGFIIVHATGLSLAEALKVIVLKFLGMEDTVLDRDTYEAKRHLIVRPYVGTAELGTLGSSIVDFLDDDAALAVGGGFSCVEDMCKLLKFMMRRGLDGEEETTVKLFKAGSTIIDEGVSITNFPSGVYAPLDSKATGRESFERLPGSPTHRLGLRDGKSIPAISKAGAVRGYACHFYMIPYQALVIAVMTNTSGIADSSQMVAKYIIQETIRLDPRLEQLERKASDIFVKNRDFLMKHATCHQPSIEFSSSELEELQGCFEEVISCQRVVVQPSESNGLCAYLVEGRRSRPRSTSKMRLIKIAENVLAFLPYSTQLSIDAYGPIVWQNFSLEIRWREGRVCALAKRAELLSPGQSNNRHASISEVYERQDVWSQSWVEPMTR